MASIIAMAYVSWAPDIHIGADSARHIEEIRRLATAAVASFTSESQRAFAELQMLYGVHVFARAKVIPDLALSRGAEAYERARAIGDRQLEFLAAGGDRAHAPRASATSTRRTSGSTAPRDRVPRAPPRAGAAARALARPALRGAGRGRTGCAATSSRRCGWRSTRAGRRTDARPGRSWLSRPRPWAARAVTRSCSTLAERTAAGRESAAPAVAGSRALGGEGRRGARDGRACRARSRTAPSRRLDPRSAALEEAHARRPGPRRPHARGRPRSRRRARTRSAPGTSATSACRRR